MCKYAINHYDCALKAATINSKSYLLPKYVMHLTLASQKNRPSFVSNSVDVPVIY